MRWVIQAVAGLYRVQGYVFYCYGFWGLGLGFTVLGFRVLEFRANTYNISIICLTMCSWQALVIGCST